MRALVSTADAFLECDTTPTAAECRSSRQVIVISSTSNFADSELVRLLDELDRVKQEFAARADESVRIQSRLQPKPLRYHDASRRRAVFRPPRCATPARFAFYQGAF
jgi:hypothetical protein